MTGDVVTESLTGGGASPDIVWVSELECDMCWRLVEAEPVGRVGFVLGGRPVVLPVNHIVDDRTIVFRTDRASSRIVPRSVTGRAISRRRRQRSGSFLPYMPPG